MEKVWDTPTTGILPGIDWPMRGRDWHWRHVKTHRVEPRQTSSANHGRVKNKKYERSVTIAWHHEITTTEATPCNTAREIRGMGGTWRPNTPPKTLRLMHGTGRGYVLWICKADIEAGMYSIVDLSRSQYTVPEAAAGRRSTRDGIASLAIHAADAMSPTRTQALSSAEKEPEPFPLERNVACYFS